MAKGISVPVVQSGLEASIQQGVKSVGKINIPATIDPSAFKNLAQPLGRVSGLATEFEKSIAASNARVLAFGASVGIINGVQNAFADLVKTGIEVQKTLADIGAISGRGGKELEKFGDELFNVGKLTGQSFKTAAQAALEFSRQGLNTEETLKRTTDALTLTRFTTLNAAEAVDVLTAAANSFGETGITTAQIINKLVAVDTKFAVSAEDLANGLARAGSIAQEVGVNFDELNAAITVAQERTARGGAVIGNALKTIFTRLRSDETVQALRDIGVESLNTQGQLKDAIPILQEVAQKIQTLSGGERVQILEAVASKYNINILSALLNDLNDANSKFSQAVGVSAGANNQAYERQIELNKTLAAQINNATVSVTQLLNKLSEIGVTDNLSTLLKFVSDLINGFNKLVDSESLGGNIAKGLVKGIADVFFTLGLPIIGAIFIKLTRDIAKFGVDSLKTILGINQQLKERQALEQAVVNTLIKDEQIMATILSLSGSRTKQEEYLLNVYNRQLSALQQVQNIAKSVAPALLAGGLSATSGRIQKRGAGGYLPAQEAADVRRGVGGANPSSKVVSIPNFAFGGGKKGTMIANTSEYIVPNFANGGSAIFNQDMVKKYGLPNGAK
jgi:TP901 family phage tail tape measure protein